MKAPTHNKNLIQHLSPKPEANTYEIGYGKPPEQQQFKPGKSGNPKGRPKGSKNRKQGNTLGPLEEKLKEIILEEAYRTIKINEGVKQIDVPIAQAVTRSIAHNAVKGNVRAQRLFAEMVASTEAAHKLENQQLLESAIEYKQRWEDEINRCEKLGLPLPQPLPHPDDVKIDPRTGSVRFTGPMSMEEKINQDFLKMQKEMWEEEVIDLEKSLRRTKKPAIRAMVEQELEFGRGLLEKLRKLFPEPDFRVKFIEAQRRRMAGSDDL